jgi:hypothetical protein
MSLDAARLVPYWPHYMPGPGTAIPFELTPLADRAEAEAAADELDGTYIEWTGHTGHQVSAPEPDFDPEPEPEAEP